MNTREICRTVTAGEYLFVWDACPAMGDDTLDAMRYRLGERGLCLRTDDRGVFAALKETP